MYKKELRRSKSKSWRKTCESVEKIPEGARLQRMLRTERRTPIQTLTKNDGAYTGNCEETLKELVTTHFPCSMPLNQDERSQENSGETRCRAFAENWRQANKI